MRLRAAVSGAAAEGTRDGPATGPAARPLPRTLIGGVGYRFQRDASFGMWVSDALARMEWPAGVEVEDLGYGALHVADDLLHADPPWDRVILVAAVPRDRRPGELYRREWHPVSPDPDDVYARVREAGGGVVDLDHLLVIGEHMEAFPAEVVVYELEPVDVDGGEGLSEPVRAGLNAAVERIRDEALSSGRR